LPEFIITTPWLGRKCSIIKVKSEIKILAKKAVQKPESLKPLTNFATNIIISAFNTNTKKPSVTMVNGSVRKNKIGRTTAFTKPSSNAEISKDNLFENLMPLNNSLTTHNERLMIAQ